MYHKREEQMKRENPKVTQETSKARLQKKLTKIQRMLSKTRLTRGDGNEKKTSVQSAVQSSDFIRKSTYTPAPVKLKVK